MDIKCGHCGGHHGTVASVRACAIGAPTAPAPALPEGREMETISINGPYHQAWGQAAPEGVYRLNGEIYRVVAKANGSGRQYAEQLINGKYVYAKGVVFRLRPEHRLTLEQAAEWGRKMVQCIRCGTPLEKEESRQAGIGPVCSTKI